MACDSSVSDMLLITYPTMQPANYCEDYPVTNYTMEVGGVVTISESLDEVQFMSVENSITADNLSENAVYFYRIHASNSVGTVSTNSTDICELQLVLHDFKSMCLPFLLT